MNALQKLTYVLILAVIISCSTSSRSQILMTDKDFVEHERQYSPDKSMLILNYGVDIGAFGYGRGGRAVLKTSDLSKNLTQFNLPDNLIQIKWLDNQTISAGVDIIPFIRSGKNIEIKDTDMNGVTVKVSPVDYIQATSQLKIEHREASPNGLLELIAYRYYYETDLSFIHISVIKKGEPLPKYGNFFIADRQSDRILGGTWNSDNTLLFYTNSTDSQQVQYFFVHDKPDVKYEIVTDDKRYGSKYRWMAVK